MILTSFFFQRFIQNTNTVTVKSFMRFTLLWLILEGSDSGNDIYLNVWQLVLGSQWLLFVVSSVAMGRGELPVAMVWLISQHL